MPRISALHKVAEATSDLTALWTDLRDLPVSTEIINPPHEVDVWAFSRFEVPTGHLERHGQNHQCRRQPFALDPKMRGQKARARQAMNMGPLSCRHSIEVLHRDRRHRGWQNVGKED